MPTDTAPPVLDTAGAYALAKARGWRLGQTQAQFRTWAKRSPDALASFGLAAAEIHPRLGAIAFVDLGPTDTAPPGPGPVRRDAAGEGHPRADGQRWLSTSQAVEVSRGRGGPGNVATLKRWGQGGQLEAIGLKYRPHGTKDNSLATFEDLRSPG